MAKWAEIKCGRCDEQDVLWEDMERALEESNAREAQLEAKLAKAVDMLRILQVHPVVLAELNYDERSEKKGQGDD